MNPKVMLKWSQQKTTEYPVNAEEWYSDPGDEDDLVSLQGSSDDEEGDNFPIFRETVHMKDRKLILRMKFPTPQIFREFLREYNVVHGYVI
ncbi:hypothetical protein U1Q18_009630 [Sarracenia purpurea var. burkii]